MVTMVVKSSSGDIVVFVVVVGGDGDGRTKMIQLLPMAFGS